MTSQVIETIYKFVGGQAAAELARVQAAEDKLGASSSKMAQGLAAAERAMGVMQAGAKSLQQKLAPTASAIAGMTSALGDHNGAAGKAVASVGQLAGAFAQGGPFGLALAAAVISVQALTKAWDDDLKAQDAAMNAQFARVDAAFKGTHDLEKRLKDVNAAITAESGGSKGQSIYEIKERYAVERAAIEKTVYLLNQRQAIHDDLDKNQEGELIAGRKQLEVLDQLQRQEIALYKLRRDGNKSAPSPLKLTASSTSERTDPLAGAFSHKNLVDQRRAAAEAAADDALEADITANAAVVDADLALKRIRLDIERDTAKEREKIAKESAEARLAVEQRFSDTLVSVGEGAFTGLLSAGQDYIAMKIAGEKNAELIATAQFLKGQGQQLVGIGTRAIFEGLVISANPLTPGLGAPLIGIGGAAVAVGLGMGAAGAGITASLPSGGGGGSGGVRDVNPAPRRSSSSKRSGGPETITVVNNFNGANGSDPDKSVKALRAAIKKLGRR